MYIRGHGNRVLGGFGRASDGVNGRPLFARKTPYKLPLAVWSHGTSALARSEATKFMVDVFESLGPSNVRLLDGLDIQLHIIPHDKKVTDLLEFSGLRGRDAGGGRTYDDLRGVGGQKFGNSILYAAGEETLVHVPGKPSGYYRGFLVSHESGHVVEQFALTPMQRKRLLDAYTTRQAANGPWLSADVSVDLHEYFASSTSAFYGHPKTNDAAERVTYTREWLRKNDGPMFRLLTDVYSRTRDGNLDHRR
jgi:hypothetical protein